MRRRMRTMIVGVTSLALLAVAGCDNANSQNSKEAEAVESQKQESNEKRADSSKDKSEKSGDDKQDDSKPGSAAKSGESDSKQTQDRKEAPRKAELGKPAPDFKLEDETGEVHQLSDYEGKTVVLEWTSPECPYVVRHYKEAETMTKTLDTLGGSDKVKWLAIDSSHFNKPKDSKKWKEKQGFGYPVLQDPEGQVGKIYGAKTTPHMYVVDKEGVLRYKGAIDDDPRGDKTYDKRTNYVAQAVQALHNGEDISPKTTDPYGCSVKYGGEGQH